MKRLKEQSCHGSLKGKAPLQIFGAVGNQPGMRLGGGVSAAIGGQALKLISFAYHDDVVVQMRAVLLRNIPVDPLFGHAGLTHFIEWICGHTNHSFRCIA